MIDKFNLNRFIDAQTNTYESALNEIKKGKKSSHWIWYIFPQLDGLISNPSENTKHYSLTFEEALAIAFFLASAIFLILS